MSDTVRGLVHGAERWLVTERRALHAVAMTRILLGLSILGLLVTNFSTRQTWAGDASVWADPARSLSRFPEVAILDGVSGDLLSLVYVVVMLAAFAFMIGWHAKAANGVTVVGFIAITAQNPVLEGAADNIVRLGLLWLLLMRTSEVWAVDASRPRPDREAAVPDWLRTGLHNVGLVGLSIQTVLVYLAAGLDKVADSGWQRGTALYTTLRLPENRPFPGLSDVLTSSSVVLALVTWLVLVVQLFFAPLLLSRFTRQLAAWSAIVVNLLFAVVLAAPWSALAFVAVTVVFIDDDWWEDRGERVADRMFPVTDWFLDRWYPVVDRVADAWFAVTDFVRVTIFRR
ncbi:hypothetical protein ASD11_03790 [Aeromicrobium sp. Root495]|uniref:HTTM domain-containing protein n=1 Tax=Aeromicrobium sp. Root495 TaxID=1736550 RepID=UPI0006F64B23|nr:HTTM domain-containing protein [Aeromicrobium sp. Root495]KQY58768.1 hypothetical protein ASD11_03790 [Aeromicrobium sp. Root495]